MGRRANARHVVSTAFGEIVLSEFDDSVTVYFPKESWPTVQWFFPGGPHPSVSMKFHAEQAVEEVA